ncbi:MAG: response regulator [Cytophagales bacterium]|nr:response regulator [Cytophagales bacterium]
MKRLVFVAEDNATYQKLLEIHIRAKFGECEVCAFSNPSAMLERLNEKPAAVVMDHFYADGSMTGIDYLSQLKKANRAIPVIYYTTMDDDRVREEAMKLGAEAYIIRDGASYNTLEKTLDDVLKKSQKGLLNRFLGK